MVTQLNQSKFMAFATGEVKAVDSRPRPQGLSFQVHGDSASTAFTVALRPKLTVGRGDIQTPVDVDLTSFAAAANGVSRKHAMFMQHGTRILILDLGSKNGTYINGGRLRTGSIYEVKDNDELQFGSLKLSIKFDFEPVTATTLPGISAEDSQPLTLPEVQRASQEASA